MAPSLVQRVTKTGQNTATIASTGSGNTLVVQYAGTAGAGSTGTCSVSGITVAAAISEDASTPTAQQLTASSGVASTTNSFSPPAGTYVVVVVSWLFSSNASATLTCKDSSSTSYTSLAVKQDLSNATINQVFGHYYTSAPGSITITVTCSNTGAAGAIIAPRVLNNASSSQPGGTATNAPATATTAWTGSITTQQPGSLVYLAAGSPASTSTTLTGATGTTVISEEFNATEGDTGGTGKATSVTGNPGATTLGFTATVAQEYGWAAAEIVPATTALSKVVEQDDGASASASCAAIWMVGGIASGLTAVNVSTTGTVAADGFVDVLEFSGLSSPTIDKTSSGPLKAGTTTWTSTNGTAPTTTQASSVWLGITSHGPNGGTETLTGPASPWTNSSSYNWGDGADMSGYQVSTTTGSLVYSGSSGSSFDYYTCVTANIYPGGQTASLSGTGTLSASGGNGFQTVTGTGTLTANVRLPTVPVAMSGTGTISASGGNGFQALAGTGTITAKVTQSCIASLSGTGTLAASAAAHGAATITGTGTLTANATQPCTSTLTGTGTLSATGTSSGNTALLITDPAGGFITAQSNYYEGQAALTDSGGIIFAFAGLVFDDDSAEAAESQRVTQAVLSGTGTISATLTTSREGSVTLTGTGALTGLVREVVTALLQDSGGFITASNAQTFLESASLSGSGILMAVLPGELSGPPVRLPGRGTRNTNPAIRLLALAEA